MRIVDAHHHVWRIGGPGQSWPDAASPAIHRDFDLGDLRAAAADVELAATVLVQSQPDDRDTDWLIGEALGDPLVGGVVAWVDLAGATAASRIATLAGCPKVRGVRPMLQAIADTDWILREEVAPGLRALCDHGLRLDALVQPRHLAAIETLARRWPQLPIVIDHGAKPRIGQGEPDDWRRGVERLAHHDTLWCKLSGLRTEQAPGRPAGELKSTVDHLVDCFGARLMWGSDWPVLLESGDTYLDWLAAADKLTGLPPERRNSLFEGAATRFYDLPVEPGRSLSRNEP